MDVAEPDATRRARPALTRERVLRAAVQLADERGTEGLSVRSLGRELGVEAMRSTRTTSQQGRPPGRPRRPRHREVVTTVEAIEPPESQADRRRSFAVGSSSRARCCSGAAGRRACSVADDVPASLIGYYDSLLGLMLEAGFSLDLAHDAPHALGGRVLGFSQELFVTTATDPEVVRMMIRRMSADYPHLAALLKIVSHDPGSTLGGCDDQFEFEFGLDLLLDGLERLQQQQWQLAQPLLT